MKSQFETVDLAGGPATGSRRRLAEVLENYLSELERGVAPTEEAFLAAHSELADELRPYLGSLRLLHGATRELRENRINVEEPATAASPPKARQIGDYRLVREIGRGGMGIVYEAHQKSLNRRVALKILPFAAVLDQRQIARFRNEAQAAAQLHHPHIVPVFAVGQEQGVHYYAMQYVDGQSLEQAIDELRRSKEPSERKHAQSQWHPTDRQGGRSTKAAGAMNGSTTTIHHHGPVLSTQQSLRHGDFFQTVARFGKEAAEALQHAHEYGVVHRDVKPSNLLIDHQGKLWVTDFGLARIQSDSGVTLTGDVVGTLRYMSPEQASGQAALVDARTDVYSLGVTLYELLTLAHAFAGDDRQSLLVQIDRAEPVPPHRLNPAVPTDLETIVLQAMAKSRDERYESAAALAEDLERFLSGKPTLARRPTLVDRAAKWARRHRSLVTLAACSLVVLTGISALGMLLLAREQARTHSALLKAEESAQSAKRSFRQARDVVDQFGVRFADRLLEIPGTEELRRELLANTRAYYRTFIAEAGSDPQLQHDSALAYFRSGMLAAKLGAAADAIAQYNEAQAALATLAAGDPGNAKLQGQLALTHNNLGLLLAARGDFDKARGHYRDAIGILSRLDAEQQDKPSVASQLAESQANLGMLFDQIGDSDKAERSLRQAIDVLRPLAETHADDAKYARNLAIASNNLSYVLRSRDGAAAERASQEAIAILERLAEKNSKRAQYRDDLALCYNNLAALTGQDKSRLDEAIEWHRKGIALQEQLARKAPAVVRHRSDLAISFNNLGVVYCRAERNADADESFARARELFSTLADDYPDELAYRSSLAALLNNQALALAEVGRHEDAMKIYPEAIELQRDCWQRMPASPLMREVLSKMYYNYGQSLRTAARWSEAGEAALARREVWQGEGQRLIAVAVEMAELSGEMRKDAGGTESNATQREFDAEVIATLRQAHENGGQFETDLATDERFAYLSGNDEFVALVRDVAERGAKVEGTSSNNTP